MDWPYNRGHTEECEAKEVSKQEVCSDVGRICYLEGIT